MPLAFFDRFELIRCFTSRLSASHFPSYILFCLFVSVLLLECSCVT